MTTAKLLTNVSQSFFIDRPTFITKVDLFFSSKDDSIPFKFNIRRNKEGRPTNEIIGFSEKIVTAANVNISSNANVATTVNFESPIFLEQGEYSLNLGSDSRAYNVYVATLNDIDITTSRQITAQPLMGTFFQSETLATFTPSEFDDLKFTLYRAKFNTGVKATIDLRPKNSEMFSHGFNETLDSDPFEFFKDRHTMKVYQFNHGFSNGSFTTFKNVANVGISGANIFGLDGNLFNEHFLVSNAKLNSYTVDLGTGRIPVINGPRVRFGGPSVAISKNRNFNIITPRISTYNAGNTSIVHNVKTTDVNNYVKDTNFSIIQNLNENKFVSERSLISDLNKSQKLSNVTSFDYQVEMSTNDDRVSPMMDSKQLGVIVKRFLVDNTSYTATVLQHELTTLSNTLTPHRANIYRTSNGIGVINLANVMDMNNANAVINGSILNVQANTSQTVGSGANNSGLYRVIDVVTSTSDNVHIKVAKLSGDIETDTNNSNVYSIVMSNDFITEEAATGGTNYSKYITREVTFNNPSTGIRFLVDASVPLNSNLVFYYKTKLAGDNTKMSDIEYKLVTGLVIPNSLEGEFVEVNHQVDNIDAFNSIIFKIVFNAADATNTPKIKNFRLIAVQ